jgi:hypothetical protein
LPPESTFKDFSQKGHLRSEYTKGDKMQTEYDYEHCYDCGKHESEESGGLTTYEGEHENPLKSAMSVTASA